MSEDVWFSIIGGALMGYLFARVLIALFRGKR